MANEKISADIEKRMVAKMRASHFYRSLILKL